MTQGQTSNYRLRAQGFGKKPDRGQKFTLSLHVLTCFVYILSLNGVLFMGAIYLGFKFEVYFKASVYTKWVHGAVCPFCKIVRLLAFHKAEFHRPLPSGM